MSRYSWLAAAAAIAFAAAACASDGADMAADTMSSSADAMAPSAAPPPPPAQGSATYTDDQLRSFAAASTEINPIAGTLSTATPEQRAAGADQIRTILQQNNLDVATYNAIAAQAQSDPAFAERIRSLAN